MPVPPLESARGIWRHTLGICKRSSRRSSVWSVRRTLIQHPNVPFEPAQQVVRGGVLGSVLGSTLVRWYEICRAKSARTVSIVSTCIADFAGRLRFTQAKRWATRAE